MGQAFVIVLRESFEAFLIVAIIFSYLRKMKQGRLYSSVIWGIGISLVASVALGFVLAQGSNTPLWEATMGVIAAVMVATLVIYMALQGRKLKQRMEERLHSIAKASSRRLVYLGVLLFTVFMITREGMETALMLIQIHEPRIVTGSILGAAVTVLLCWAWVRYSSLINVKLFFQVTGVFLLLFVAQILLYSFHEFSEAGVLPNSEALHAATERFSPEGLYGKWFSSIPVVVCGLWLAVASMTQRAQKERIADKTASPVG